MTSTQIKENIDSNVTNKTVPKSISNIELGNDIKSVVDYIDQELLKNSGSVSLTTTPSVLPYTINSCSFTNGIAYLPTTTKIGNQIYVIAVSNNIEIRANSANTNKMFNVFNTFISNVILTQYQMYRFTYIGFGSGIGSTIDGYWKAELI